MGFDWGPLHTTWSARLVSVRSRPKIIDGAVFLSEPPPMEALTLGQTSCNTPSACLQEHYS